MPDTLGDIRLRKLETALENRAAIVKERMERLKTYAASCPEFRTDVDKAVSITKECHSTAEKYRAIEDEVNQLAGASTAAILDRVIASTARAALADDVNRKAREFLSALVAGQYSDPERSVADELKAKYSNDPDLESLTVAVSALWIAFDQQRKTAELATTAARLSHILRGLLYAGLIGHYGDSLDRKERVDSVKDLAVEVLLSAIPGAGVATKLVPVYRAWFDLESPPPDVDAGARVVNYLTTYTNLMEMWNELMPQSVGLLETCRRVLSGGAADATS